MVLLSLRIASYEAHNVTHEILELTSHQRKQISNNCRNPQKRILARNAGTGHNWHPFTVRHPDTEAIFNDDAAWDFIADHFEGDTPLRWRPASALNPHPAIEMLIDVSNNERRLYMKVGIVFDRDLVLGLSFHYSTEEYRA